MAAINAYSYLTASGLVKTGPGVLHSITLSAAAATGTATVYDEVSGSGDVMARLKAVTNDSACAVLDVAFGVGCYVAITGAGATVSVGYR